MERHREHPLRDAWWRSLVPDLERITVPALVNEVRDEDDWPVARTRWTDLYVSDAGLTAAAASNPGQLEFLVPHEGSASVIPLPPTPS